MKLLSDGSSLKSYDTEKDFSYEIAENNMLKGRIDNIERLNVADKTYISIIDYKSGKKKIKIEDSGDSSMFIGSLVDINEFKENNKLLSIFLSINNHSSNFISYYWM